MERERESLCKYHWHYLLQLPVSSFRVHIFQLRIISFTYQVAMRSPEKQVHKMSSLRVVTIPKRKDYVWETRSASPYLKLQYSQPLHCRHHCCLYQSNQCPLGHWSLLSSIRSTTSSTLEFTVFSCNCYTSCYVRAIICNTNIGSNLFFKISVDTVDIQFSKHC